MCYKTILENGGTLKYIPDCYKNQEMCNKAVDNYPLFLNAQKSVIKLLINVCLHFLYS